MPSNRAILRQIEEQGLDPKIPYVLGKDGKLVPKKAKIETTIIFEEIKAVSEKKSPL